MLYGRLLALARLVFTATNPHFIKMSGVPAVEDARTSSKSPQPDFMQFSAGSDPVELETDIVIVGSGCGAAVCARNLSKAGHRVLVLEKGYHYGADALPMSSGDAIFNLMEGAFTTGSDDGGISVLAASCFGGGATTSWNAASPLPDHVRQEWVKQRGLALFESQEFQECHEHIVSHLSAQQDVKHNHGNQTLLDGAAKLGWTASTIAQATYQRESAKSSQNGIGQATPATGWFADAAKAGIQFVQGCKVEQVLFDSNRAVGVRAMWTGRSQAGNLDSAGARQLIVKAKKVILSAGALWSPLILQASGLKVSEGT